MSGAPDVVATPLDDDARRLKELGYNQELERSWSGIHELRDLVLDHLHPGRAASRPTAKPGTTAARSRSRGAGRSSAASSSSSVSACRRSCPPIPTAGGIYYWALRPRRPRLGLVHRLVQPDRPRRRGGLGRLRRGVVRVVHDRPVRLGLQRFDLTNIFIIYVDLPRGAHAAEHLPGAHPPPLEQRVGVVARARPVDHRRDPALLRRCTDTRASRSCSRSGSTTPASSTAQRRVRVLVLRLPLGFLLTQYTQTGYDACAHCRRRPRARRRPPRAASGRPIFWSAVGGWILLILFTFAATNVDFINNVNGDNPYGAGYVVGIFASSLSIAPSRS